MGQNQSRDHLAFDGTQQRATGDFERRLERRFRHVVTLAHPSGDYPNEVDIELCDDVLVEGPRPTGRVHAFTLILL